MSMSSVRATRLVTMTAAAALPASLVASPVAGAQPMELPEQLIDDVGALAEPGPDGPVDVQAAFDELEARTGTRLWVWLTDTTEGMGSAEFAIETAHQSALGPDDLLLVIAFDDAMYGYWYPDGFALSSVALEEVIARTLIPWLISEDVPRAIDAFATGLGEAMAAADEAPASPDPAAEEGLRMVDDLVIAVPAVARGLTSPSPLVSVPEGEQLVAAFVTITLREDATEPASWQADDLIARLDGVEYVPGSTQLVVSGTGLGTDEPLTARGELDPEGVRSVSGWVTFRVPVSDGPIDVAYGEDQFVQADLHGAEGLAAAPLWLRPAVWLDVPAPPEG
jgi:uncharacterized membrane protein YgcG